ncbi:PREDICTED: ubiquitin carboxyl-terminal hydrolase [Nicrophorus vespilloides]|uniref:Ubiquitin carboxyl-terminal hydrolase n=1 Tax=Nicrophorus vespilloides TaxID=110193 RepID=A0ABM1MKQ8_NICVS|nr:PREDICTED: ubiquitin carboxyl-terminal hydrolase [Nicrophorus vespilloides]XP_017775158.1 PREDICTED: ubiquitin carboxyl-terminal hydrolase [Nicrophorus vespilloides]
MVWLPLESNPDVMNKFLEKMGVSSAWKLIDVFGLDSEALAWVPRPVLSVILLFPCSEKYYEYSLIQQKEIEQKGQEVSPDIFYMKQLISNACGTIALIHSIGNNIDRLDISNDIVKSLFADAKNLSPIERGNLLQTAAVGRDALHIANMHQELAKEGQTELNPNEQVNHHFVTFVHKDGVLYELDGRKEFPINHGATTPDTLLEDAAKVCKDYIQRESDDVNFTVMALTAAES